MIEGIQIENPILMSSQEEILVRVSELGKRIAEDYCERVPLFIGVLKGAFVFLADLIREFDFPLEIDFIRVSSYRSGTESKGIELIMDTSIPVEGRHVIVVDGIVDTGATLKFIVDRLKLKNLASLSVCALIDKKERREVEVKLDYVGFEIENGFVIGYGLDLDEKGRELRDIYLIK
jgi:hypoxanthine phosphoribosyltransferase